MPDDFREYIDPVRPKSAIDRLDHERGGPPPPPAHAAIHGRVLGIRRGQQHKEGPHRLDVTVGGEDGTDIVVRVPPGAYANLEGKKVVLYVDE